MQEATALIQTPAAAARLIKPVVWPNARSYRAKLDAIRAGESCTLYPGEFLQYLLLDRDQKRMDRSDILPEFEQKIGRSADYLSSNVFYTPHRLPKPLQEALAALTETSYEFWDKDEYAPEDAKAIEIKMGTDISAIVAKYQHLSRCHSRASNSGSNALEARGH